MSSNGIILLSNYSSCVMG